MSWLCCHCCIWWCTNPSMLRCCFKTMNECVCGNESEQCADQLHTSHTTHASYICEIFTLSRYSIWILNKQCHLMTWTIHFCRNFYGYIKKNEPWPFLKWLLWRYQDIPTCLKSLHFVETRLICQIIIPICNSRRTIQFLFLISSIHLWKLNHII